MRRGVRVCTFMKQNELTRSLYHPCMFYKVIGERDLLMVGVAIDDLLKVHMGGTEGVAAVNQLEESLSKEWKWKHGPVETILGWNVKLNDNGSITVLQQREGAKIKAHFFPDGHIHRIRRHSRLTMRTKKGMRSMEINHHRRAEG